MDDFTNDDLSNTLNCARSVADTMMGMLLNKMADMLHGMAFENIYYVMWTNGTSRGINQAYTTYQAAERGVISATEEMVKRATDMKDPTFLNTTFHIESGGSIIRGDV